MKLNSIKNCKGSGFTGVLIFCMCFVFFLMIVVSSIEYFVPINKYGGMKDICRKTLYRMEISGGLSASERNSLTTALQGAGFTNLTITGTSSAKAGEDVTLRVEGDFTYSKLNFFLSRSNKTVRLVYDRTMCSQKVIN